MNKDDLILISVDDHIAEPADMFDAHVPAKYKASAPRVVLEPDGVQQWYYGEVRGRNMGLNAVAGKPREMYNVDATSYDEMRPGCFNVDERIRDMNPGGQLAGLNFPHFTGFSGQALTQGRDRDVNLVMIKAYHDWHVDEWGAAYPGRFIPCGILPTWNMDATVAEIKRLAAKGVTAVSINENPTSKGLPSIHNAYWEPMWKAITDHDMVICLHIGGGNPAPHASMETPIEAWITTMPMSISLGAADWLHLEALHRYPTMKIALSEGGIGWVPYFMERADFSHWRHKTWTPSDMAFGNLKPSDVFKRHFMLCFIDDKFGLQNLRFLNEDLVSYECDYPHSDTLWPEVPEHLWDSVKHLSDELIDKVTHKNAMRFWNFDPFKNYKREELTVGALRAKAVPAGVE